MNDLLKQGEKVGGRAVRASSSRGLANFMDAMGMVDLSFVGCRYTWLNRRSRLANIRERIDRGVDTQWRMTFSNAGIVHYDYALSDHVPIVINIFGCNSSASKPFKFEKFWAREAGCFDVVAKAWCQECVGSVGCKLVKKIRATRHALLKWNKSSYGNIQEAINLLKSQLSFCQQGDQSEDCLALEQRLMFGLDEQLKREEELWRQKSRVKWLT